MNQLINMYIIGVRQTAAPRLRDARQLRPAQFRLRHARLVQGQHRPVHLLYQHVERGVARQDVVGAKRGRYVDEDVEFWVHLKKGLKRTHLNQRSPK